jgi:hypothetical protein
MGRRIRPAILDPTRYPEDRKFKRSECKHERQYVLRDSTWPEWRCANCGKYMGDLDI